MSDTLVARCGPIMAGALFFGALLIGGSSLAATTVTSTTTKNGTVTLSASAQGADRKVNLPCTDGSVRQCKSNCMDGTCSLMARWKSVDGDHGTAGLFTFPAKTTPAPETAAHQWCLALVNSMGAPLGSGGGKKSTLRSVTNNGHASVNGFSCATAIEPGVFGP